MKKLWVVTLLGMFFFTNCIRKDGDIVQINCQVLNALVPIRIRLKSNLPHMTKGAISVQLVIGGNRLADSEFSIISNSLDTIIQAQTFSNPEFIVWGGITTQDTFRATSMILKKAAKRDSILTLSF